MRVSATRRCTASPEQLWPWIAEPEKHVQTLPDSVTRVEVRKNGDIACVVHAMGASEPMVVRVVETHPPRRLVEERVDGRRQATTVFDVAADGAGSLVTLTSEVDLPRLLAAVAKGPVQRGLTDQLANLDRLSATAG
jgi:carbon monoxide dehydrogenase subunit G